MHSDRPILGFERIWKQITHYIHYVYWNPNGAPKCIAFTKTSIASISALRFRGVPLPRGANSVIYSSTELIIDEEVRGGSRILCKKHAFLTTKNFRNPSGKIITGFAIRLIYRKKVSWS